MLEGCYAEIGRCPEPQIRDLMAICKPEKMSRAEAIRLAIVFYKGRKPPMRSGCGKIAMSMAWHTRNRRGPNGTMPTDYLNGIELARYSDKVISLIYLDGSASPETKGILWRF